MKFFKIFLIFLIILSFSIGIVSAEDINEDTLKSEINDEQAISTNGNTYTDLNNEIQKSTDIVKLKTNYAYNKKTDKLKSINITKNNFVIEGNNYIIDANKQASIFNIINVENITIKNIVFKNANNTAIYIENSSVTLNNIIFKNNQGETGGGIYALTSELKLYNNTFMDNYAYKGSSIYIDTSTCNIKNSIFIDHNHMNWSMIYGWNAVINVKNSIFANTTSQYATAIYNNMLTYIENSKFYNLYANLTAGAIGVKGESTIYGFTYTTIEDCEFSNVSSNKNGGALYIDINGNAGSKGSVIIKNTVFNNCFSQYGGAILQLGGLLYINYSNFINNLARYSGGAIYTSNTSTTIKNTNFKNNIAIIDNGGGAYIDYGIGQFVNNNFIDNTAYEGGSIYAYDTVLKVELSNFANNKEAIHSVFTRPESYEKYNKFNTDQVIWNDVNYRTNVYYQGKQIILNRLTIIGNATDAYFNLHEQGLVTPVKDQGQRGSCWAFGINAAIESAFLIATNISLDISENNVANQALLYSIYGDIGMIEGGYEYNGANYFLSWFGVVSAENDVYDELGKISPILFDENAYHMLETIIIDIIDTKLIKESLTKYGALTISMFGTAATNRKYYNSTYSSLYYNGKEESDHIVTLVGWDDNYPKENFNIKPPGDGAWICKNSWGTEWGDEGYFYLSYYDNSLKNTQLTGFIINNTELYNKLYQYDDGGQVQYYSDELNSYEYENIFISEGNDLIAAVGTYFEKANTAYTIKIYVNDRLLYIQSGKSEHAGYSTIKLNKYIKINQNDKFAIAITSSSVPLHTNTRQIYQENVSYILNPYQELSSYGIVAIIKAYTIENKYSPQNPSNLIVEPDKENAEINIMKDGTKIGTATVMNGKGIFDLLLNPGNFVLIIPYENMSFISRVEILDTIITDKIVPIKYNVAENIKIKYLDTIEPNKNTKVMAKLTIPYAVKAESYKITVKNTAKRVKIKHLLKIPELIVLKTAPQISLKSKLQNNIKTKTITSKISGNIFKTKNNIKGIGEIILSLLIIILLKIGILYTVTVSYIKDTEKHIQLI